MATLNVTDAATNRAFTIDSSAVSRVIDFKTSRLVWVGPSDRPSPNYQIKEPLAVLQAQTGFVKVLLASNEDSLINPAFISFIDFAGEGHSNLHIGTCNVPSTFGTVVAAKEKVEALIPKLGLLKVATTAPNLCIGVNRNYVTRIIEMDSYRIMWFGVSDLQSVSSTKVLVQDELVKLQQAMGLVKLSSILFDRSVAVNRDYVSGVQDTGSTRKVWMGVGRVEGVRATSISVKETVEQLKNLGIG